MDQNERKALELKLSTIELRDYPELEGLHLTVDGGDKEWDVRVAGCCYDVGITMVDVDNNKIERVCLNGRTKGDLITKELGYDFVFRHIVNGIVDKCWDALQLYRLIGKSDTRGVASACAFR
jgi:hypothetical protein